jgi:hypothetical protein
MSESVYEKETGKIERKNLKSGTFEETDSTIKKRSDFLQGVIM